MASSGAAATTADALCEAALTAATGSSPNSLTACRPRSAMFSGSM